MATIIATEIITLDGVVQAPGRPDEDTRGGFAHGGWAAPYADQVAVDYMLADTGADEALLFGRRTYDDMLRAWTTTPEPNPFTGVLVETPKYVVSRSADTELAYPNSTLLAGDATATVAALKEERDGEITVLGSIEMVRALAAADLVDEYLLSIHPLLLGSGTTLFSGGDRTDLRLLDSITTTTGVVIARYTVR